MIDISVGTISVSTACDVNSGSPISCIQVDWHALLKKEGKFGTSCQSRIIKHALQPELCRFLAIANDLGEIFVVPLRNIGVI